MIRDLMAARFRPRAVSRRLPVSDGAPVMTLPGFCAGDSAMARMRAGLCGAGFRAHGWRLGVNLGPRADTLDRLEARIHAVAERDGRPVHLVGWSLGGVMAREYAKQRPELVASVVSMGAPFSGSRRANHAWRLYRLVAGHSVDALPMTLSPLAKPPVPTFALWSPRDGVIAPASARGDRHESDRQCELDCTHMGFSCAPEVIDAVVACLVDVSPR